MVSVWAPYSAWLGIVRCLKSASNIKNLLLMNRPMHRQWLWVELPPVRSDVSLKKYILHLYRYFTSEDQKYKYKNIYFAWAAKDE